MDDFWLLLVVTVFLRGVGSGMITGVLFLTMPVRSRLDSAAYARFIGAMYQAWGVKVYAGITVLGLALTIALVWWAFVSSENEWTNGLLLASLTATVLGFIGTAGAFPTMKKLWTTPTNQSESVAKLLSRFGRWGVFSAACHVVAFILILGAWYVR